MQSCKKRCPEALYILCYPTRDMPELPEVETLRRQLENILRGKKIMKVEGIPLSFSNFLSQKITTVSRRAKVLILELENRGCFFIRLGMTGYFSQKKNDSYARVKFSFSDGSSLLFCDIRKFGSVRLLSKEELQKEIAKIGPEPLEKEFTPTLLYGLFQKKKNAVLKPTLMDQSFIAGIGNIYAQEALYSAGINPQRKCGTLTRKETEKLHTCIQTVLQKSILAGGSTVENYRNLEGAGNFQQQLVVYQQEKCPKKHALQRIILGGRGTWFCKECQK